MPVESNCEVSTPKINARILLLSRCLSLSSSGEFPGSLGNFIVLWQMLQLQILWFPKNYCKCLIIVGLKRLFAEGFPSLHELQYVIVHVIS